MVDQEREGAGRAERIDEFLIRKEMKVAPKAQVFEYLTELVGPVLEGKESRRSLVANLLNKDERGPLSPENQRPVKAIRTSEGWRAVRHEGWWEALGALLDTRFGVSLAEALRSEEETECKNVPDGYRQETFVPTLFGSSEEKIYCIVVREYSLGTSEIKLLGLEIGKKE